VSGTTEVAVKSRVILLTSLKVKGHGDNVCL